MKKKLKPKNFILDVDGVLTTGQFLYDENGKKFKIFGPDDSDALNILKKYINIVFVSADKRGFKISKKRVKDDMGYPIYLVQSLKRVDWIDKKFNLKQTIYMGDGFYDHLVMKKSFYSISTSDSDINAKKFAKYITKREGGKRAVAEASMHILKKFFKKNIN